MKNIIPLIILLFSVSLSKAQNRSDIFNPDVPVTWLGIDFTEAKFIGDRERLGSESDIHHLMTAINDLILAEPSKYNVAKAISRKQVENNIAVTTEHNDELDATRMYSDDPKDYMRITHSDIEKIVSEYDFKGVSGLGLMFNVESFNKLDSKASVYVTFINIKSKEVLFTERLITSPGGFGLRNYWAGSLYQVLEQMKKKEFENWKKKTS